MDINEYNKYKNDKIKFASNFFHAVDPRRGKHVKSALYKHQKTILKIDDNLLIKKSRQVGISEILSFEIAYHLNYTKDYNMLVVCPTQDMANDMKAKVMRHFSNIPDNIRVGTSARLLKNTYASEIGAHVEFRKADPNIGRSATYDTIYLEEVDYINNFDNIYMSLIPTLSRNGKMVISTTPSGNKTHFQHLWNSKNKFNKLFVDIKSYSYNAIDEKSLNALSKAQYDKIIRECVIL